MAFNGLFLGFFVLRKHGFIVDLVFRFVGAMTLYHSFPEDTGYETLKGFGAGGEKTFKIVRPKESGIDQMSAENFIKTCRRDPMFVLDSLQVDGWGRTSEVTQTRKTWAASFRDLKIRA